jgi:hypothetical protein
MRQANFSSEIKHLCRSDPLLPQKLLPTGVGLFDIRWAHLSDFRV